MNYIYKQSVPTAYANWLAEENEGWHPTYSGMPAEVKRALELGLYQEQHAVCAYCTDRILLEKKNFHVEHLYPQTLDTDRRGSSRVDYYNMVASCFGNREIDGDIALQTKPSQIHCGEAKEGWFAAELFVSPLQPEVSTYFSFLPSGRMIPSPQLSDAKRVAAETTITKLNLNSSLLVRNRSTAVGRVVKKLRGAFQQPTRAQLSKLIEDEIRRREAIDGEGKITRFQLALLSALRREQRRLDAFS